jgi:pilus assembly protein CpaD
MTMHSKLLIIALASVVGGCVTQDRPDTGVAAVHVPVVTSADYVFDAAAPAGGLAPGEAERLNGWFQGLDLGFGDRVFVDGGYGDQARGQVAAIAGQYGMLVSDGSPVTAGAVQPGSVRVVVSRRRAVVPGCPDWSLPAQPNVENRNMSNFGCGVNSNFAAMVADPQDLVHGREGTGAMDVKTGLRAVQYYRSTAPTGTKGLENVSPKGGN